MLKEEVEILADSLSLHYDYDINPLQMYSFIGIDEEKYNVNEAISVTYDGYKHLFCRDIHFPSQQ